MAQFFPGLGWHTEVLMMEEQQFCCHKIDCSNVHSLPLMAISESTANLFGHLSADKQKQFRTLVPSADTIYQGREFRATPVLGHLILAWCFAFHEQQD